MIENVEHKAFAYNSYLEERRCPDGVYRVDLPYSANLDRIRERVNVRFATSYSLGEVYQAISHLARRSDLAAMGLIRESTVPLGGGDPILPMIPIHAHQIFAYTRYLDERRMRDGVVRDDLPYSPVLERIRGSVNHEFGTTYSLVEVYRAVSHIARRADLNEMGLLRESDVPLHGG